MARTCAGCGAPLPPPKLVSGPQRKWCSERCRKTTLYSGVCVDCGARTAGDGKHHDRCGPCSIARTVAIVRTRADARKAEVLALRRQGLLNTEIAERIGCSRHAINILVSR